MVSQCRDFKAFPIREIEISLEVHLLRAAPKTSRWWQQHRWPERSRVVSIISEPSTLVIYRAFTRREAEMHAIKSLILEVRTAALINQFRPSFKENWSVAAIRLNGDPPPGLTCFAR